MTNGGHSNLTVSLKVAFAKGSITSLNSYGYSPHPLATYLDWIQEILQSDRNSSKPFIISITSSSPGILEHMVDAIQIWRRNLRDMDGQLSRIAIELNTSCPNIRGESPPSYDFPSLSPLLDMLAAHFRKDNTLTIGLKLPPYVHSSQFDDVIRCISSYSIPSPDGKSQNPFAFFTCTNTLGNTLLFSEQTTSPDSSRTQFVVPPVLGGLAGDSIHALSLGNVYTFSQLLAGSSDEALRRISIIGVGGVTCKEAAERMRKAGAKVVGCATLFGKEGVAAFEKLS